MQPIRLNLVPTVAVDRILSNVRGVTPGRILQLTKHERRVLCKFVAAELRQQGYSLPAIAEALGYGSHQSVHSMQHEAHVSKEQAVLVMRPIVIQPGGAR